MKNIIELHDSDIAGIEEQENKISVCFSEAYLYAEEKGWSQEAKLILDEGKILKAPSSYPVCISDGELDMDTMRYFNFLELPFSIPGKCKIVLVLTNGESLIVEGSNPRIELFGERKFIEYIEQT